MEENFKYKNYSYTYNPLEKHNKKCEEIFYDILNWNRPKEDPYIFVRVETVDSRYETETEDAEINISEEDDYHIAYRRIAEFSVLTKKMYEYDKETILSGMLDENSKDTLICDSYRPYFASMMIEVDDKSEKELKQFGYNWQKAIFVSDDEIIRIFENNKSDTDNKKEEKTKYLKGRCLGHTIEAVFVFAASPVRRIKGNLIIFPNSDIATLDGKNVNDLVKGDYDITKFTITGPSDKIIENEIINAWQNDVPGIVDIYNVGHGNADYIRGNKHRILYDIGYNYRCIPKEVPDQFPKACRALRRLKPSIIILSHWDSDHYIGCVYAGEAIFDVKWIAPALTSAVDNKYTLNAFRMAAFLKAIGKLILIERTGNDENIGRITCGSNYKIILRMGNSKTPETCNITKRNREGLYIEIQKDNEVHTLLSGDVTYQSMVDKLFQDDSLVYMHVPHHCSEMKLDKLKATKWNVNKKYAIISSNKVKDKSSGKLGYKENQDHTIELGNVFKKGNVYHTIGKINNDANEILSIRLKDSKKPQIRI